MTAAELRAIGERIRKDENRCGLDRALLYAALERLINQCIFDSDEGFVIEGIDDVFATKDAAIDALLGQGGGE